MLLIMEVSVQERFKDLAVFDHRNLWIAGLNPGERAFCMHHQSYSSYFITVIIFCKATRFYNTRRCVFSTCARSIVF